jgi:general transcriptional corepressor TUP1
LQIWDIQTGALNRVFKGHQEEVYSIDFFPDGRFIVSGSGDKTVRIWNMDDGNSKVLTFDDAQPNTDLRVACVAISPNGQLVAAATLDSCIHIWDAGTGNYLERLGKHGDYVYSVKFTPDGKGLVSGSLDKTLKYWDVTGFMSVIKGRREGANDGWTNGHGGSANGKTANDSLCRLNLTGHKVWPSSNFSSPALKLLIYYYQDYVVSVAVSNDGKWIASGSKDRGVRFWDANSGIVQFILQGHKNTGLLSLAPLFRLLISTLRLRSPLSRF